MTGLSELSEWFAWPPAFERCFGRGVGRAIPGARIVGDDGIATEPDS